MTKPLAVRVLPGDCREVIPQLVAEGITVDAICCDPPYHLTEIPHVASGGFNRTRPAKVQQTRGGFMGQSWDGGDVAFRPETWAAIATVLRPGGFLLAFGGTRTYHRLVCAIEDAGFVIQDAIGWLYGSGFPKRRDMLKPAMELICVAYKPGGKRTLQVDECRIPTTDKLGGGGESSEPDKYVSTWDRPWMHDPASKSAHAARVRDNVIKAEVLGRWPANVCHDGSDEVLAGFPWSHSTLPGNIKPTPSIENVYKKYHERSLIGHTDSGSVARFFYCAKADGEDRFGSRHPTIKPVELLKWLVPLVTPKGGTVLDPFAGTGTTGVAAMATGRNVILIEREAGYVADIRTRLAHYDGEGRHSLAARARNRTADELLPLFKD